jgi:hypothetical protein
MCCAVLCCSVHRRSFSTPTQPRPPQRVSTSTATACTPKTQTRCVVCVLFDTCLLVVPWLALFLVPYCLLAS